MILDEAQAIKSSTRSVKFDFFRFRLIALNLAGFFTHIFRFSIRWKLLLDFPCRNRLLLTGTPIQNSMAEVRTALCDRSDWIFPPSFFSRRNFWFHFSASSCGRYCISSCRPFLIRTRNSTSGFPATSKTMRKTNRRLMTVRGTWINDISRRIIILPFWMVSKKIENKRFSVLSQSSWNKIPLNLEGEHVMVELVVKLTT